MQSQTVSLPAQFTQTRRSKTGHNKSKKSRNESSSNAKPGEASEKSSKTEKLNKDSGEASASTDALRPFRSISAPINYKEFLHIPMYTDFHDLFINDDVNDDGEDQKFISYNEDKASEQQTESDIKNLEEKISMSLQQIKERIFSSMSGLEEFKAFLADTNGIHLFNFWLDCETFKDLMAEHDEIMKMASRNQLFRDIQDKYRMTLTSEAKTQIQQASSSYQLSHTVFIRTQYDVLRRLRTYWVPRFILHKEKANDLSGLLGLHNLISVPGTPKLDKLSDSFLPKLSLVHSLPIDHNTILNISNSSDSWPLLKQGGKILDSRVRSGVLRTINPHGSSDINEKLIHALQSDKGAGGPFRAYLSKFEKSTLLSKLMFWEAVTDYGNAEERLADRLLRMNQAWSIYNIFLSVDSPYDIGIGDKCRSSILDSLQNSTDFISVSVFDAARHYAQKSLVEPWTLYLKYDVKLFLDAQAARFGTSDLRPTFPLDSITVYCEPENPRVLIKKPLMRVILPHIVRQSSASSSIKVRRTPITESARIQKRQLAKERRKELRREQIQLLKTVRTRQQEVKQRLVDLNAKSRQSGQVIEGAEGAPGEGDEYGEGNYSRSGKSRKSNMSEILSLERKSAKIQALILDKEIEFLDMVNNRPMISLFKRYLISHEAKDLVNALTLYNEIDVYYKTESKPKTKKDLQANFIYKSFMDGNSKKAVKLSEKIMTRLSVEKDRPKSPTLNETQKFLVTVLNPMFKQFFEAQADEFGVDTRALAVMPQAELAMRSENDAGLLKHMNKRAAAVKGKKTGRAPPSKDDKMSLMHALNESLVSGKPTLQMNYFWKYLIKHGDEENNPLIDKDLMFYLEVQKYKELMHNYTDEEMVKRKCQAIIDCFLESTIAPPCQIDISSDMCSRIIKNAVKVMQGKEMMANLFDEAQFLVFKEVLPYWAGFMKTWQPPEDPSLLPLSKHQKALKKRYEEFINSKTPQEEKLILPSINKNTLNQQILKISTLSYSITDGLKARDSENDDILLQNENDDQDLEQKTKTNPSKAIPGRRRNSTIESIESL